MQYYKVNELSLFISYSSADKPFVKKLDAALSFNGVPVFLDDRDIAVGDSIPTRIYEGIEQASHLVYVISPRSIESKWVQEELDVAKMRQSQKAGFKILPVLIEDCSLPVGVAHIKYADFRQWEDGESFSKSLHSILAALAARGKSPFFQPQAAAG